MDCDLNNNDFKNNTRAFTYVSGKRLPPSRENSIDVKTSDCYGLFYVTSGRGFLTVNDKEYIIEKGQSFMVFPHTSVSLRADSDNPWGLYTVQMKGSIVTRLVSETEFRKDNPVTGVFTSVDIERYFDFVDENENSEHSICRVYGKIIVLLSYYMEHFSCDSKKNTEYVYKACDYIRKNYHNSDCTVQRVADYVKLDRTYLYRIFKKETGMSMIEYINNNRVGEACMMLIDENVSVKDVALCVGFADQMYFSRVFKKFIGQTPTEYRKFSNYRR